MNEAATIKRAENSDLQILNDLADLLETPKVEEYFETCLAAQAEALGGEDGEDRYTPALERWLALGGADLQERTAKVLAELGLDVDGSALMSTLSG